MIEAVCSGSRSQSLYHWGKHVGAETDACRRSCRSFRRARLDSRCTDCRSHRTCTPSSSPPVHGLATGVDDRPSFCVQLRHGWFGEKLGCGEHGAGAVDGAAAYASDTRPFLSVRAPSCEAALLASGASRWQVRLFRVPACAATGKVQPVYLDSPMRLRSWFDWTWWHGRPLSVVAVLLSRKGPAAVATGPVLAHTARRRRSCVWPSDEHVGPCARRSLGGSTSRPTGRRG